MKTDTQHLDFLLSQYADGLLEGPGKKLVEQQLAIDPQARTLLKQHTEVQELIEDWGSRIPLIDWNQFDQELSAKLAQEVPALERTLAWRRGLRPLAAAAALLFAASVGYWWHASPSLVSLTDLSTPVAIAPLTPIKSVEITQPTPGPSLATVTIEESNTLAKASPKTQTLTPMQVTIHGAPVADATGIKHMPLIGDTIGPMVRSTHAEAPATQPTNPPALDSLR